MKKALCTGRRCGWRGYMEDVLEAPNPFDEDEKIYGCPNCKAIDTVLEGCDEPECKEIATCGTPADKGYRRTCGKHIPKGDTK
jgi:hypothetical protein